MTLLQRRPDLGPAAFSAYWRTRHRDVVLAVPGIRGYVQNHPAAVHGAADGLSVDGIVELWFDGEAAMAAAMAGPAGDALRADEPNFMAGVTLFVVDDGAPPAPVADAVKAIAVVRGDAGLPAGLPGLLAGGRDRVLWQGHRESLPAGPQPARAFDTLWLDRAGRLGEPAWQAWLRQVAAFVVEPIVVVAPPAGRG